MLFWLAKSGRIELLKQQYQTLIIPPEVYAEVVENGLKEGYTDAHIVKEAVKNDWLIIDSTSSTKKERITDDLPEIHEREAAAMSLALSKDLPILIDESSGRALATALGLHPRGSLHVVLRALHDGSLTSTEARDTVAFMVSSGFRIEPHLLERILREITRV